MNTLRFLAVAVVGLSPLSALADKLVVQAPNYPLYYFAKEIASESFEIRYRVDPEVDPAFWEPSDEDLIAYQKADIILRNGGKYSKWMHHASLPSSRIVDTTREIRDQFIETEGELHTHGDGKVHSHGGITFTTWLDFRQAIVQANAIARRFRAMKPGEASEIEENLAQLTTNLEALDKEAKKVGTQLKEIPFVASHPVYQYFSRAYDVDLMALEWEPEMEISPKHESELKAILAKHPAKHMIWEGTPSEENVAKMKEMGLESVVFSPAGNKPEEGDFLSVMKDNLEKLSEVAP
ncbi:MAG: metal ABC transporter substrate-binding protein [Verrucomicrobiales bacterium]|nr:metal ABC transporter substrate-binding protein [Verrucomicrobiales bacterium]